MQINKLATGLELSLRAMTSLAQLTLSEMDLECESPRSLYGWPYLQFASCINPYGALTVDLVVLPEGQV